MRVLYSVVLSFVLSLTAVVSTAKAQSLLNYAPKNSAIVIDLNAKKLLQADYIKDALDQSKDGDIVELKQELAGYGLTIDQLFKNIMLFVDVDKKTSQPIIGVLAKTDISEAKARKMMAKECQKNNVQLKNKTINGKTVYLISNSIADDLSNGILPVAPTMKDDFSVTYLNKNTVLFTGQSTVKGYIDALKSGSVGRKSVPAIVKTNKSLDKSGFLWGCINLKQVMPNNTPQQPGQPMAAHQNIESGSFSLDLAGKNKKDLKFDLSLACKDSSSVQMLALQCQMLTGALSMHMNDNPELALEISQALKVIPKNKNLNISLYLKESTLEKIKTYGEKKSKKGRSMGAMVQ